MKYEINKEGIIRLLIIIQYFSVGFIFIGVATTVALLHIPLTVLVISTILPVSIDRKEYIKQTTQYKHFHWLFKCLLVICTGLFLEEYFLHVTIPVIVSMIIPIIKFPKILKNGSEYV